MTLGTDYIVTIVTLDSSDAEVSDTVVDRRVATLDAPTLSYTAAPTTMTVGTSIAALTATATGFTGTLGYSVTTGSLPAGLGINATTARLPVHRRRRARARRM